MARRSRSKSSSRSKPSRGKPRTIDTLLRWHLLVFTLLNGFLATINFVFSPSVLWFLWVTGTWGMALVMHAFAARNPSPAADPLPEPETEPKSPALPSAGASHVAPSSAAMSDAITQQHTELGSAPTRLSERAPAGGPGFVVGQRVANRFVIERKLGAGGMGEVYLAHDSVLDERVALKTVSAALLAPSTLDRFRREAQAARRITHPNIVRIHDLGQDGATYFISMEYIEGETLRQYAHRAGPLSSAEIKRIALSLCDGLQAAHAAGVVHRDLKPDNVLIDRQSQVRVIDFGLARLDSHNGLTATGAVLGTPDYMAPEQLRGEPADARTDVYAMGCILYYLVRGTAPFERASAIAVGLAHCQDMPELPAQLGDHGDDVRALILRALEKNPASRFQSAAELRTAIESIPKREPIAAAP
jgi:tRNA A-37 threonylcarbamoyl transferase component Bud32